MVNFGLNYNDSIVLYNKHEITDFDKTVYVGTRIDNVRIELTQAENIRNTGNENADTCVIKIPKSSIKKNYVTKEIWNKTDLEEKDQMITFVPGTSFWIIAKKSEIGVNETPPEGILETSVDDESSFLDYISKEYGYCYMLHTVDVYQLLERFQLGGK